MNVAPFKAAASFNSSYSGTPGLEQKQLKTGPTSEARSWIETPPRFCQVEQKQTAQFPLRRHRKGQCSQVAVGTF